MALLDKLNKLAKNIEDKTGDAIELSKHSATITSSEHGFNSDIKKIGEFYYDFFINGGQVEPNILPVLQSAKAHQEAIAEAKSEIERINAENAAEREAAKAERAAAREAAKAEKEAARLARQQAEMSQENVVAETPAPAESEAGYVAMEEAVLEEPVVEEPAAEEVAVEEPVVEEIEEEYISENVSLEETTVADTCPGCGAPVEPGTKFCGECGYKMEG